MGENSSISWTDHTFNAWHGCTKIAHPDGSGCDHCYADTLSVRFGRKNLWGKDSDRLAMSDAQWRKPLAWNRDAETAAEPAFVFCASMGDVFEPRDDLIETRNRLFDLIGETPWLVWLLLTKRPEQMRRLAPESWDDGWPSNVWAGTSVEHQAAAELRIPRLLSVPASRRFLSCEPLLGPIDLSGLRAGLDWVIVGGESGAGHRALDLAALGTLVAQCDAAGLPVWVKQDSGQHAGKQGRIRGELWRHERPAALIPVGVTNG